MTDLAESIATPSVCVVDFGGPRRRQGGQAQRRAPFRKLFAGNEEPPLRELLGDPIVHRLMRSDGVRMSALLLLIGAMQRRFR